jgi:hypothetical protein
MNCTEIISFLQDSLECSRKTCEVAKDHAKLMSEMYENMRRENIELRLQIAAMESQQNNFKRIKHATVADGNVVRVNFRQEEAQS